MALAAEERAAAGRVLIVDDDPLLRSAIGRTLERAGLTSVHAANGAEALERLASEEVDVVLTDYDMPILNGLQLIERGGADHDSPVFVLLTGVDGLNLSASSPDSGLFGVLRKPVDDRELLQTIGAARQLRHRRIQQRRARVSVLLLEDDVDDVALFMAYTRRMSLDVGVAHFDNLGQALDAAARAPFDVAVVDLHMADSQGFDPLRKLRAVSPTTAVVILTHRADDTLAEQALAMGAQEFLVKRRCAPPVLESALRRAHARKQSEKRLVHVATHDPLTDLANASTLRSFLRQRVERIRQGDGSLALLFTDLDGFKRINDIQGHAAGDAILRHVARCLEELTRGGDLAARMGGDEFALLLSDVSDERAVYLVAERLIEAIEEPVVLPSGKRGRVSASIGVALCPHTSRDAEELLAYADEAMYAAKAAGGGVARSVRSPASSFPRNEIEALLRTSVREGGFALAMQAQQPLLFGRPITYEALVRWPARPELGPDAFIPWLEDLSLLDEVSGWVIDHACRNLCERLACGEDARVAVNLSPRFLRKEGFERRLTEILHARGVPAGRFEIEIAEAGLPLDEPDFNACLERLRQRHGVRVVLDGFGAGFAPLSALRDCSLDGIKLDAGWVHRLAGDARSRALAEGLVFLAHRLSIEVVAEGVETAEQLRAVEALGCDAAQGFFVRRPQLVDEGGSVIAVVGG